MKNIIRIALWLVVFPAAVVVAAVPGAVLGAYAGYGVGGPIGAIAGVMIGPFAVASNLVAKIRL